MRARLRQATVAAVPPAWLNSLGRGGLSALMLWTLLLAAGCRNDDQKAQQEATDAKAEVARLQLSLKRAVDENTRLNEELKAVKQTRDELQDQVDQLDQDREHAAALARQAGDMIARLTTQADGQAGATASLERQVAELQAQLKDRDAVIEMLQKGAAAAQPVVNETSLEGAALEETPIIEPNEIP